MNWDVHIGKTNAKNAMVRRLVPEGKDVTTIIGFGDAGVGTGLPLKGFGGPRQEFEKQLRTTPGVVVLSIWEYRSTIACFRCWRRLANVCADSTKKDKEDSRIREVCHKAVYKLLECTNIVGAENVGRCGCSIDRDENAARNMLMLLVCLIIMEDRPAAFTLLVRKLGEAKVRV